jgi:hypothetical protein
MRTVSAWYAGGGWLRKRVMRGIALMWFVLGMALLLSGVVVLVPGPLR